MGEYNLPGCLGKLISGDYIEGDKPLVVGGSGCVEQGQMTLAEVVPNFHLRVVQWQNTRL